jgi:hypothetical protein
MNFKLQTPPLGCLVCNASSRYRRLELNQSSSILPYKIQLKRRLIASQDKFLCRRHFEITSKSPVFLIDSTIRATIP